METEHLDDKDEEIQTGNRTLERQGRRVLEWKQNTRPARKNKMKMKPKHLDSEEDEGRNERRTGRYCGRQDRKSREANRANCT